MNTYEVILNEQKAAIIEADFFNFVTYNQTALFYKDLNTPELVSVITNPVSIMKVELTVGAKNYE